MKNKKRFAEIIATLGAVFQREVEKPLVRIYWEVLSKYSDEQIEAACKAALSRCKFFPKPAEIEELIPSGVMSPPEAWGAVMETLEFGYKISFLGSVQFCQEMVPVPDPATLSLLSLGGLALLRRKRP